MRILISFFLLLIITGCGLEEGVKRNYIISDSLVEEDSSSSLQQTHGDLNTIK